jgi:hypothetical protein
MIDEENTDDHKPDADGYVKPVSIPSPREAIRGYCLWCSNGSAYEVRSCSSKGCSLWPFRLGPNPTAELLTEVRGRVMYPLENPMTGGEFHEKGGKRAKAIKHRCVDCAGSKAEARKCRRVTCELHPFRMGNNPNRAMSPTKRAIAAARLHDNIGRNRDCK